MRAVHINFLLISWLHWGLFYCKSFGLQLQLCQIFVYATMTFSLNHSINSVQLRFTSFSFQELVQLNSPDMDSIFLPFSLHKTPMVRCNSWSTYIFDSFHDDTCYCCLRLKTCPIVAQKSGSVADWA